MPLYIMVDENSEVSLSLENVDNYESRKGTHFTLKGSYFTILYHIEGPIDVAY